MSVTVPYIFVLFYFIPGGGGVGGVRLCLCRWPASFWTSLTNVFRLTFSSTPPAFEERGIAHDCCGVWHHVKIDVAAEGRPTMGEGGGGGG